MPSSSASALRHIPGSLGLPVLGDTVGFLTRPVELFNDKQRRYGDVFKARLFGRTAVYLLGAEANKFVLVEQARHCSSQEGWRFPIGELFHGGLMLRDGEEHKSHRGILQAAFKKEPMRQYLGVMAPIIERRLAEWGRQPTLRVFPAVKHLTLELAGKVFFDLDFSQDLARLNQAMADLVAAATAPVPFNLPFTQYRRGMQGRGLLQEYFGRVLQERRQAPAADMLSHLCQAEGADGQRLTDAEIVDHLIFFLMAAHDTTASTLTSLFYELGTHPDWQERLRAESQAAHPATGPVEQAHLGQLEQLGYVLEETLRLHPPLILIPRQTTQELTYNGFTIPANTHLSVLLYHNHQNPAYWTAPDQFDPLRFAAGRQEHRKCPFGYAPFGAGQHHCLGFAFADMQVKLVMHHLLRRYRWRLPAGYRADFANIPIQHPKDGLPVQLEVLHS
ncbi:cytochrome P450 [Hymenobacter weizhouensis]|uniref:cytochrome P450 n=1 Tax=Hymenobacter sp. YIM 151500-1 TaxID=2987689 RepID=UPI0022280B88|nr:cytochrome P450 [Hymenobacter sp. YIM 151500-1]UYZ64635.1 cytochrome P450 [Hymenobacter sp. YIM 151500-1]